MGNILFWCILLAVGIVLFLIGRPRYKDIPQTDDEIRYEEQTKHTPFRDLW